MVCIKTERPALQSSVICLKRETLLSEYHEAIRAYREAVLFLDPELTSDQFQTARRRSERARVAFERKSESLKNHEQAHGCKHRANVGEDGVGDVTHAIEHLPDSQVRCSQCNGPATFLTVYAFSDPEVAANIVSQFASPAQKLFQ